MKNKFIQFVIELIVVIAVALLQELIGYRFIRADLGFSVFEMTIKIFSWIFFAIGIVFFFRLVVKVIVKTVHNQYSDNRSQSLFELVLDNENIYVPMFYMFIASAFAHILV